jgi:putative hydrolase of the HAD superfamily
VIDWLLVDYGETISRRFGIDALTHLADLAGQEPREFLHHYWQHRSAYDLGEPSQSYWSRVLGCDPADITPIIADLNRIDMAGWSHINHDSLRAFKDHANRAGVRLALLSNAPETLAAAIDGADWSQAFAHRIYSCRTRLIKPDQAAFAAALELMDAEPQNVLFIDDRPDNVRAATELGLSTITFSSASDLTHQLINRGTTTSG